MALAAGGGAWWMYGTDADAPVVPEVAAIEPDAVVVDQAAPVVEAEEPNSDVAEVDPEPEAEAEPEPEPEPEAEPEPEVEVVSAPQVDNFRREPDGIASISGRADPNMTLEILLSGAVQDRVETNGQGHFFAFLDIEPSDQPRRLSIIADPDGQAVGMDKAFFVEPFGVTAPEVTAEGDTIVAGAVTPIEPEQSDSDPSDENVVSDAIEDIFGETEEPTETVEAEVVPEPDVEVVDDSPTVLVADEEGVRVLSNGPAPAGLSQVALDTITYDPEGEVALAGRATSDGFVQVYVDNRPITTARIEADRNWKTDLPEVDTGVHTLRIDEVDADGNVVSRIETPFKREEPEVVAAVMAEETAKDDFDVAVRTVQPGATLWAIAQEKYGSGVMYVAVYDANADLIRDPDLIYPGQIFVLPEIDGTGN